MSPVHHMDHSALTEEARRAFLDLLPNWRARQTVSDLFYRTARYSGAVETSTCLLRQIARRLDQTIATPEARRDLLHLLVTPEAERFAAYVCAWRDLPVPERRALRLQRCAPFRPSLNFERNLYL